jgi:hypothetical protein
LLDVSEIFEIHIYIGVHLYRGQYRLSKVTADGGPQRCAKSRVEKPSADQEKAAARHLGDDETRAHGPGSFGRACAFAAQDGRRAIESNFQ